MPARVGIPEEEMKRKKTIFMRLLMALALLCVIAVPSYVLLAKDARRAEREDMMSAKVMGHLEHKGTMTTIYAGQLGFYYTVRTRDGRTIAEKVPERRLRSKFEKIYRDLKRGVAGNWAAF